MPSPLIEVLFILLLILANGALALSEMALVTARKTRLQGLADRGSAGARAALALASHPDRYLATIQIGITLVGILAGVFGGATLAEELAAFLDGIPWLAPYGEPIAVAVVVLAITYVSLVAGELLPKRLALGNPERIASRVAGTIHALSRAMAPAVRFLGLSTEGVARILRIPRGAEPPLTAQEIRLIIRQGVELGLVEHAEREIVENVFRLGDWRVSSVMTPRTQIVTLDVDDPPAILRARIAEARFSRYPVVQGGLDNPLGIVRARALLSQLLSGAPIDLRSVLRQPVYVSRGTTLLRALELFREKGVHVALVTDEYGGIQGMLTHHDILEMLVGWFPVGGEPLEPEVVRREDGSLLVDGMMHRDRLWEVLGLEVLPAEEEAGYQTVGGLVQERMGTIPAAGQVFLLRGFRFEVVDMDGRRVDKVLVTKERA